MVLILHTGTMSKSNVSGKREATSFRDTFVSPFSDIGLKFSNKIIMSAVLEMKGKLFEFFLE